MALHTNVNGNFNINRQCPPSLTPHPQRFTVYGSIEDQQLDFSHQHLVQNDAKTNRTQLGEPFELAFHNMQRCVICDRVRFTRRATSKYVTSIPLLPGTDIAIAILVVCFGFSFVVQQAVNRVPAQSWLALLWCTWPTLLCRICVRTRGRRLLGGG